MEGRPEYPLVEELLDGLRQWCDQQRGRKSEVARKLGVSPQTVTDWLNHHRKQPTGEQALLIQQFLKTQKKPGKATKLKA